MSNFVSYNSWEHTSINFWANEELGRFRASRIEGRHMKVLITGGSGFRDNLVPALIEEVIRFEFRPC